VYSTQKRGWDRDQICKVYDSNNKLLGVSTTTDYNYYRLTAPIQPPPVKRASEHRSQGSKRPPDALPPSYADLDGSLRAGGTPMLELIDKGSVTDAHPTPLLFVHGGCHAAWCWDEHFLDYFASQGFRAVAVSLRAHGGSASDKPLRKVSVADFVDDEQSDAAQLGQLGR